jgi:hypothetical protein
MAKVKTRDSFEVRYSLREDSTGDDIKTVNINWENRTVEQTIENLNIWLKAVGLDDVEVSRKITI